MPFFLLHSMWCDHYERYVSEFETMIFCLLDWLISILGVWIGNPLRWPPELLIYSICTFSIINNAIAKVDETDSKLILLFMLCPKCTKEDSYLALASKSPLLWSLHVDDDCCDRCWSYWCHWRLCIMVIAIIIDKRQLQLSCCWKIHFSWALIFCAWL